MNLFFTRVLVLFIGTFCFNNAAAQNVFFRDATESQFNKTQKRIIVPKKYRTITLNKTGLINFLKTTPSEKNIGNRGTTPVIEIPLPGGGTARFKIWESSVMDPGLAAKYPTIQTFTGQGIDDPTANIKLDFTPAGFHAMIISSLNGTVFIDPYSQGNTDEYISYNKSDYTKAGRFVELPALKLPGKINRPSSPSNVQAAFCIGAALKTYRLALAGNGEYTNFHGGTVALALAAQATTMNRVNGVYERELAIRMVLVPNNDLLIFTSTRFDPYTNANTNGVMLNENQVAIDSIIGDGNYDIGHVFSTGGGGIAGRGVVCVGGQKAKGVTGTNSPIGDPFDIDYVAHEMGHQFGANHPFNSLTGACNGNGELSTNAEPGSGSTIMAYAGICGSDNLQANSDAQFHAVSFDEIADNTTNSFGSLCAMVTNTGNVPPVVNAGVDFVIPASTPFVLSGGGTDANGDVLTFSWEQIDVGGNFGPLNNPTGDAPIFRSFVPVSTPVRYFPKRSDVVDNITTKGELLPTYSRTLNFRLTARDNRAGGGGVCFDESAITVSGTAGPFIVTFPNVAGLTWLVNDFKTIIWNPAGTEGAPINCSNVKIELSTDGGFTFPVTLTASTPNDGLHEIQVPSNITTTARIRVMAVGNVFYDISNFNFTIQNSAADYVFNNPQPVAVCATNSAATDLKTAALNGFTTAINLSAAGFPAGSTITFSTNPVTPGGTTIVTLNNTGALAPGTYNVTINGDAGGVIKQRIISFVVSSIPAATTALISPSNNATGIQVLPSFNWSAVAGATAYSLEIATTNSFAPVLQTINNIANLPCQLITPLAENTVYYWRVKSTNGYCTSNASTTGIFKTGITTCRNSTDVPKAISGAGIPTITSVINIPASAGVSITDLNVTGLKGKHGYINDLTITLTSPIGTVVTLFNQICNGESNFHLNLDDESAVTIFPCPPVNNVTVKPQSPLAAFDGQSSTGTWTLTVQDNFDGDGGSLTGWGLTINNCLIKSSPISTGPAWTQLCPPTSGTSLTSNITGAVYQWQVNTVSGFVTIANNANYSGVNTVTLAINNAPSSWNGFQYRCVVDATNSNVFTLGFTNYWNGSVSNAWENPLNWSCNSIPDANTDVFTNNGTIIVNSNAICRSLTVNPAALITVNAGFKITVVH